MSAPLTLIDPGLRDLWIEGTRHEVPHPVFAHFKFLHDLVSSLAESCARSNEELAVLQAEELARRLGGVRWTPALKEALALRSQTGQPERDAVLLACGITPEELDGWIERYGRFGREGLKPTRLQVLGRTIP